MGTGELRLWEAMVSELNLGRKEGLVICSPGSKIPTKHSGGRLCERWQEVQWGLTPQPIEALQQGSHVTRAVSGSQMGWGAVTSPGTGLWL